MIFYYYPRPFLINHSEPLEDFMKGYVADILLILRSMQKTNPSKFKAITSLKSTFKEAKGLPLFPVDSTDPHDPNEAPFLYLYFALGDDYNNKSVIGIADRLVPGCDVAETIAEQALDDKVSPEFKKDMMAIEKAIDSMRSSVQHAWKNPTSNNLLDMQMAFLLNKKNYIDKIHVMYDFRKTGGLGNTTLLKITLFDYVKYVWMPPKGVVPKVWLSFVKDMDSTAGGVREWLRSPKVNSYVMKLPATIAGIETFEHHEHFTPSGTEPGDVIESFGFLKGLLEIPKTLSSIATFFTTLISVAQALVTAITNPIAVLRILIGMIAGIIILITYIIIVSIDFLLYIPAAIVIAAIDVYKTIWHILLFILIASFYLVIWVLDMVTGGLFLKIMRCENLPSKWYLQPGYFFDNKYVRGFMCSLTCSGRYIPNEDGGWCERLKRGCPSFCPQQVIFNAARTILTGQGNSVITPYTSDDKLIYKFAIPSSYYTMNEVSKKTKLVDYLKDKQKFEGNCFKFSKEVSSFTVASCNYFNELQKAPESSPLQQEYQKNKDLIDKALKVCKSSCTYYKVLKTARAKTDKGKEYKKYKSIIDKVSFCPEEGEIKIEKIIDNSTDGKTIGHRVIYSLLVLSVLMTVFAALYYYTFDKNFDFLALWQN